MKFAASIFVAVACASATCSAQTISAPDNKGIITQNQVGSNTLIQQFPPDMRFKVKALIDYINSDNRGKSLEQAMREFEAWGNQYIVAEERLSQIRRSDRPMAGMYSAPTEMLSTALANMNRLALRDLDAPITKNTKNIVGETLQKYSLKIQEESQKHERAEKDLAR